LEELDIVVEAGKGMRVEYNAGKEDPTRSGYGGLSGRMLQRTR
jgi:hypothetical protein